MLATLLLMHPPIAMQVLLSGFLFGSDDEKDLVRTMVMPFWHLGYLTSLN